MLQPIDLIQELATHPQVSQTPPREHLRAIQRLLARVFHAHRIDAWPEASATLASAEARARVHRQGTP
jgi:hypothetical protein